MRFPADNQPAEPVQPSKQPLHDPAAQITAQYSAVLGLAPLLAVGSNHPNSLFLPPSPKRASATSLLGDCKYCRHLHEIRSRFCNEIMIGIHLQNVARPHIAESTWT